MSLFALARHHPRRLFIIYPSAVEISRPSDQRDYFWIHAEKRVIYITCTLCSVALFVPVDHSPIYYTLSLERCICGEEQLHRYRLLSEIEIVAFILKIIYIKKNLTCRIKSKSLEETEFKILRSVQMINYWRYLRFSTLSYARDPLDDRYIYVYREYDAGKL